LVDVIKSPPANETIVNPVAFTLKEKREGDSRAIYISTADIDMVLEYPLILGFLNGNSINVEIVADYMRGRLLGGDNILFGFDK
jgi:hypothetical protein